jgi:hypothetical protein
MILFGVLNGAASTELIDRNVALRMSSTDLANVKKPHDSAYSTRTK